MCKNEKIWIGLGPVISALVFAFTRPTVHVYFVTQIGSQTLAIAAVLCSGLKAVTSNTAANRKIMQWYRNHFSYLLIIDLITFAAVTYSGYQYPDLRFIGMTVCDAVTLALLMMIMASAVNRKIGGDDLTEFTNAQKAYALYAAMIGGTLAIFFDPPVELCLALQVAAVASSHVTMYIGYKKISK